MSSLHTIDSSRRFKVALSFPGEHRGMVSQIAAELAKKYSKASILYDQYHQGEFARPNLDTYLQNLYVNESELIVVFICSEYNAKAWCGIEWRSIRNLLNTGRDDDRLLFVKCGDGEVDGTFSLVDGYLDSAAFSVEKISMHIISRHDSVFGTIGTGKIKYNIMIMDDDSEQLEMLKGEIDRISENETKYELRVSTVRGSTELIEEASGHDFDIYILDITRAANHKWQTGVYDYYGRDLYWLLVREKPNILIKSKFFIYSKLPNETIREEAKYVQAEFYRKQDTAPARLAQIVKEYIDSLYYKTFRNI